MSVAEEQKCGKIKKITYEGEVHEETHDMTLEATVVKGMWVLGQRYGSEKRTEVFLMPVNYNLLVQEQYQKT